jgi:6-phosphofructo-2-kinase
MSHRMGAALSGPSSPTIQANGDGNISEVHHLHGVLPPPALTNALKTLKTAESGASGPPNGLPNGHHYDSPYSRSISSTAPASPRM